MKFCKKDHAQIKLLKEYFEEVNGYLYLIEINLLLLELEYEYNTILQYDEHFDYHTYPEKYIKH